FAVLQLGLAAVIVALGAGGGPHALLLLLWLGVAVMISWRYLQRGYAWVEAHLAITNGLVERMVGHRTRLMQERPTDWHEEEDVALARYLQLSEQMDRMASLLLGLVPRGWMVLGLGGLAWSFVVVQSTPAKLAIGLGGTLLALQAWTRFVRGVHS